MNVAARSRAASGQEPFFRPIVGARAFAEVVDQLTYAVRSGRLSVGERLPTIDQLAREMGVSRPTIGEAVRVLADAKVLRVHRGATGGVEVISQIVPAKALRLSSQRRARRYSELVEARHAIELELAKLACTRATKQDIAELEDDVRLLTKARGGSREWERAHLLFHYAIGRAAHSELLAYYHHQVLEEMTIFFGGFPPHYADEDTGIRLHTETLEALLTGDVDKTTRAMIHHLEDLERVAEELEQAQAGISRARRSRRAAHGDGPPPPT
jgi:GntR family transcriptional repressor for pyruvate dehydrogenase complex